jgi:homoserine kinase
MVACFQTQEIDAHGNDDNHQQEQASSTQASSKALVGYSRIALNPDIAAVVVIPDFELSTAKARAVVPQSFSRADLIFNLQRVSVLCTALSAAGTRISIGCGESVVEAS